MSISIVVSFGQFWSGSRLGNGIGVGDQRRRRARDRRSRVERPAAITRAEASGPVGLGAAIVLRVVHVNAYGDRASCVTMPVSAPGFSTLAADGEVDEAVAVGVEQRAGVTGLAACRSTRRSRPSSTTACRCPGRSSSRPELRQVDLRRLVVGALLILDDQVVREVLRARGRAEAGERQRRPGPPAARPGCPGRGRRRG